MLNKEINHICIVGGGSSGWITAAYALAQLPWAKITLVESPNIPTVGVGEATILNFDSFLNNDCKIPPLLWQDASNAVVKTGILFPNWKDGDKTIWHPFYFNGAWMDNKDGTSEYHPRTALGIAANVSFQEYVEFASAWYNPSVDKKQLPDMRQHGIGWHLDAIKLAKFLSEYLQKQYPTQLTHILGDVSNIIVEDGDIKSFTVNNELLEADVYIDCTGFKRLLSSSIPGSKFEVADKMLFANAAVAGPVAYETEDEIIPPYTICQACEHGWIWKTSIDGRIGSGLVYNDSLLSKEEAEQVFIDHWGKDRLLTNKFNHISFTPEYNTRNWRGNCFSVGLASGFLEPLESTGLHLLIRGAKAGLDMLKKRYYSVCDQEVFNSDLNTLYSDCIDYVGLHYMNNTRHGPFWDLVRKEFVPSDSLKMQIELFEKHYITDANNQQNKVFSSDSWRIWLHGSEHKINVPENPNAMDAVARLANVEIYKNNITNNELLKMRKGLLNEQSLEHTNRSTTSVGERV